VWPAADPALGNIPAQPRPTLRARARSWWSAWRSVGHSGARPTEHGIVRDEDTLKSVLVGFPAAGTGKSGENRLDELYRYRRLSFVRLALLLVDDMSTAEDVVQDAFAAALRRHGPRLTGVEEPEAYLRTCVVNSARSVLRRRRTARAHVPEPEQHASSPEDEVLLAEEHREVLLALRLLTHRQREVLVLRYWSNLTEAHIADTLGLARGTVKSTASRALDALSRHLGGPR
jgi:RNA polymerase sigma-70 factor (sigma-E family)